MLLGQKEGTLLRVPVTYLYIFIPSTCHAAPQGLLVTTTGQRIPLSVSSSSLTRKQLAPLPAWTATSIRTATINVGTLMSRHRELAGLLKGRRSDIVCIQETKRKDTNSRKIGHEYKLLYYGTSNHHIAVAERFQDNISLAEQISDRLIAVKTHGSSKVMRGVAAYAPQAGSVRKIIFG